MKNWTLMRMRFTRNCSGSFLMSSRKLLKRWWEKTVIHSNQTRVMSFSKYPGYCYEITCIFHNYFVLQTANLKGITFKCEECSFIFWQTQWLVLKFVSPKIKILHKWIFVSTLFYKFYKCEWVQKNHLVKLIIFKKGFSQPKYIHTSLVSILQMDCKWTYRLLSFYKLHWKVEQ